MATATITSASARAAVWAMARHAAMSSPIWRSASALCAANTNPHSVSARSSAARRWRCRCRNWMSEMSMPLPANGFPSYYVPYKPSDHFRWVAASGVGVTAAPYVTYDT